MRLARALCGLALLAGCKGPFLERSSSPAGRPIETVRVDPLGGQDPRERVKPAQRRRAQAQQDDNRPASQRVEGVLATRSAQHLLGDGIAKIPLLAAIDAATVTYDRLDFGVLERDLERVERFYRRRGFYDAKVQAARVRLRDDGKVDVEIVVQEGPLTIVKSLVIETRDLVTPKLRERLESAAKRRLPVDGAFDEDLFDEAKAAIARIAAREGHAHARVAHTADVRPAKHEADVVLHAELGPKCVFGEVSFEGAPELPRNLLTQIVDIKPGKPFSTEKLEQAELELAGWGITGSIEVKPQLRQKDGKPDPTVPIVFVLGKAPLRSVKLGAGAEVGGRVEVHAVAGWENKNLWGGLRRFSVDARPGLVFFPTRIDTLFTAPPSDVLPELRTKLEFRQPLPIDVRTSAVLRAAFNAARQQTTENQVTDGSALNVYGYIEGAGAVGFDRPFFGGALGAGIFYNLQYSYPFSYNSDAPPPGFGPLLLSYLQGTLSLDYRRNAQGRPERLRPNKGIYVASDIQFAGYFLGGDASDVRLRNEIRGYIPITRDITLAMRVTNGLLFPENPDKLHIPAYGCERTAGAAKTWCEAAVGQALQLLQFRAFFSGGASSNRGYGYNGVGPQRVIPSVYRTDPSANLAIPIGGATLWEASVELRFPIAGALGGVAFVDSGNVGEGVLDFRFDAPHITSGLGLRVGTPIGPLRLDLGVRVPCLQVIGVCDEPVTVLGTPPAIFGLPVALSFAIGEAY